MGAKKTHALNNRWRGLRATWPPVTLSSKSAVSKYLSGAATEIQKTFRAAYTFLH
jgi:hypothetical protein